MHTYAVLSHLLLQLSVPLGALVSLCLVWARLRRTGQPLSADTGVDGEANAGRPTPGVVLLWAVIGLAALGLHVALGQALWRASIHGNLLSCGDAGCPGTWVNLSEQSLAFWLTALVYWLGCILAPLLYLCPLAQALRAHWRARQAREAPFADTAPLDHP